jgi:hypothetical protein
MEFNNDSFRPNIKEVKRSRVTASIITANTKYDI